jgi:hypothetical protein
MDVSHIPTAHHDSPPRCPAMNVSPAASRAGVSRPIRSAFSVLAIHLLFITQLFAAPTSDAYVGAPFGVGRVTIDVFRGEPVIPMSDERFTVWEESSRVMYPVLKDEPAKKLFRQLLSIDTPRKVTIYYLFQGSEPFDLSVFSPVEQAVRVKPQNDAAAHRRLLDEWWQQYTGRWNKLRSDPQFPPVAENFLAATFARRLQRELPEPSGGLLGMKKHKDSALGEMFAGEAYQLSIDRQMLQPQAAPGDQKQPLPEPIAWQELPIDATTLEEVAVEPIATHVPAECFYLRFGTFTNYLWFRDLSKKWQGDLQNMILRRGINRVAALRTQQQLSLKESALAKIVGPQVIADAAIIGLDPYSAQGAGIGILFQAKNNFLLAQDFNRQRLEALQTFPDAEQSTVKIAGRDVSLVATPDGRVRSYYVQSEDFHLVATSSTLIQRFLEAGQGEGSLADLPSFLQARGRLPLERGDVAFAFLSEKFFQNLCSPHYRIETLRRLKSTREPLLLEMAALAAVTENRSARTTEEMIAADLLPNHFATRLDGSALSIEGEQVVDSRRGAAGFFVPVADMAVADVSADEAAEYHRFTKMFQQQVGQMPPIAVGIQRLPRGETGETMKIEVLAEPLTGLKINSLRDPLGEPSEKHLRPVEGDVVSLEAVLDISVPLIGGEKQPHHLFGGLRDSRSILAIENGKVAPGAEPAEFVRGYVGAWPRPGLLQLLAGSDPPDSDQPEQVGDDLWQAQQEDFLLISFKSDVVDQVLPQLAMEPAPRPAQIWLTVDDLTGKQLAATVNAFGYKRTRETSVAASRMMNSLANQFRVARPECRALAERLVDGTFVCPLGGEYQLFVPERDLETWASSALPAGNRFVLTEVPEDFQLPLLNWFRGLRGDLQLLDDSLSVQLEIDMTPAAVP